MEAGALNEMQGDEVFPLPFLCPPQNQMVSTLFSLTSFYSSQTVLFIDYLLFSTK